MLENDPLYKLRHALVGLCAALFVSVFLAAWLGAAVAGLFADSYGARVTVYSLLLLYVVAGAVMLFVKVARHETQALSWQRLLVWLASLWCWPLLLLRKNT